MNENKIKKKTILKTEEDIAIPFINSKEENKALNQLLYYVYDDDFVVMINELSTSILNYHKIISKCFVNIRILLNKMGESPYATAIEGNCSNLESSFKKFYSNAKVVFRKMKLYRNEKFKNINNNKNFQNLNQKNDEKNNGLTIIINNNNNNASDNIDRNRNFIYSPKERNSQNSYGNFHKSKNYSNSYENDEKNYSLENKIFNFSESILSTLFSEKNNKISAKNQKEDLYLNKNYVINKNNNIRIDFYEYLENTQKKIAAKINYLIESKNKVFADIESLIETSQKEKKEFKNQINSLQAKIKQLEEEKEINSNKYLDKKNKLLNNKEKNISELNEKIKELEKKIELKENELKTEKAKYKEILDQKNELNNELKEKNEEILNLEEENEKLSDDLKEKNKEFIEYKQKYLDEIKSKEDLDILNNKYKKEIEKYKTKIDSLEENNEKILEELNLIKTENNKLIKENKVKEKEISLLKSNKNEINLELKNIEKEYQDDLDKKEKLINEFNEKYNELNEQYIEINNKNSDLNKKIKELNTELNDIKFENEKLTQEINIKEEEYESIKDKYITLIENKSRDTKIFEKNKNKVLELEKEIVKKNNKLIERKNELDKNQEEIAKYQSQINSYQNELKTKNDGISELNIEKTALNEKIENYKKLIAEEKIKNKELEEKYNQLLITNQNINIISNKLKVSTIDASRTKSANKLLIKNKAKFLIKGNYSNEFVNNSNNSKNIIKSESSINNSEQELELTPDNYIIVKCTELSSKLRWYLFKKKSSKKNINSNANNNAFIFTHLKSYFRNSKSYRNTMNNNSSKNPELYDATYEDFIWKPFKNQKEFSRFGELPISETKENFEIIEDLNKKIKKLEENIIEKEKEYEILYINYNILNQKNKNFEEQDKLFETIDKLTKENEKLSELVAKYKNEKNDEVGLSFIDNNDLEGSKFLDDKSFKDIFINLDSKKENDKKNELNSTTKSKKINISKNNELENKLGDNNKNKDITLNKYLKDSINLLMNQVNMSQNAKSTLSSILIQLGCSDEDVYKIMGNYRGTISIGGIIDKK